MESTYASETSVDFQGATWHYIKQTKTRMYLWNSAMGDSLQFQQLNPTELSIQDCPIHSERTFVYKQPQDPWRCKKN
jgi:hypothetical protein